MNSTEEKLIELIKQYRLEKDRSEELNTKIILEKRIETLQMLLRIITL